MALPSCGTRISLNNWDIDTQNVRYHYNCNTLFEMIVVVLEVDGIDYYYCSCYCIAVVTSGDLNHVDCSSWNDQFVDWFD